ncbi:MAG: hypothetical protein K2K98_09810 [Muribaculaceae bacterium]|nr:hypothetical protein [Muribaculaceae bacterium]
MAKSFFPHKHSMFVLLLTAVAVMLYSCSHTAPDEHLTRISEIVSDSPQTAIAYLDSIDSKQLSEADRHLFDLLTIKANDKAYIAHRSDSLIRDVISYYERHDKDHIYAEALYYGGRVSSDLGDYPTSLRYFQNALDMTPADENPDLRSRIASQTGRLLNKMSLYKEATPYIEEALAIEREMKDTMSVVYDLQLLGCNHLREGNYKEAERFFKEAISLSGNLPIGHKAKSEMYLAATKRYLGDIDSAVLLIRHTPDLVKPIVRNSAIAYASSIYLDAGKLDTAYLYAYELMHSADPIHHEIGYQTLLSPQLAQLLPADSLYQYVAEYRDILERYYDENESQLTINQQAFYNYQSHEKEKLKAISQRNEMLLWLFGIILVAVVLAFVLLWINFMRRKQRLLLYEALDDVERLKKELFERNNIVETSKEETPAPVSTATNDSTEDLRIRLRNELLSIYNSGKKYSGIPAVILQSDAYLSLQAFISEDKVIPAQSSLWKKLESAVTESSPNFKSNLHLLTGGSLSVQDYRLALLIKCGVTPTQLISLLGRTKGTISYRRETLCYRVFEEKLGSKVIDGIIRLL